MAVSQLGAVFPSSVPPPVATPLGASAPISFNSYAKIHSVTTHDLQTNFEVFPPFLLCQTTPNLSMSTTTQILFNSPALHSLKREQLIKLCKIHSIKANGKNVDLIQRLRHHAQTLPKDSPLSVAARSESKEPIPMQPEEADEDLQDDAQDDSSIRTAIPRPSEQWEMVMDSIEEVEENSSQGSLSSQRTLNNTIPGEFGTGSSRSTTVTSSIKALATSLGWKRNMPESTPASTSSSKASATVQEHDELAQNSTPYSALPLPTSLPQTDHFVLDDSGRNSLGSTHEAPLPGHSLRPGIPAPPNARLSLGLGPHVPATPTRQTQPTTTIRLVSNHAPESSYGETRTPQLKPFKTSFDITFGSPIPGGNLFSFGSLNSWPPNDDVEMGGIYPKLTVSDLPPLVVSSPSKECDVAMRGTPSRTPNRLSTAKSNPPSPFVFGSPSPQHRVSNHQFRAAAASVLEEMNARLRAEGIDEIGTDIVDRLHPHRKVTEQERDIKPLPSNKRGEISSKFNKAHEEEFSKMEGIDNVLKRKQASPQKPTEPVVRRKRKSSVIEQGKPPRRPSAMPPGRPNVSATRVISNGRRARALPGAFGMDDDDEDDEEPVNNHDSNDNDRRGSKRVRMDPEFAEEQALKDKEEEKKKGAEEREREAIKRKLEANRARRRSSAAHLAVGGRKSVGGPRKSVGKAGPRASLLKPKPKPSRFGFFSSAKSLVQSVWNRGKTPAAVTATPSHIPKPISSTLPNAKAEETTTLAPAKEKEKMGPPSLLPMKKSTIAPAKSTTANASGSKLPSLKPQTAMKQGLSAPMTTPSYAQGSVASSSSSARSRSPIPSFGTMSSIASGASSGRNSLQSNAARSAPSSAIGTARSRASSIASSAAGVSSVGTRASSSRGSGAGGVGSMGLRKPTSRTPSLTTAGSSSSRLSTRLSTSSRLLAPTASSLAKTAGRASSGLKTVAEGSFSKKVAQDKEKYALNMITNSSTINTPAPVTPASIIASSITTPFSPSSGRIFSKPLLLPIQSGIPTPAKRRSPVGTQSTPTEDGAGGGATRTRVKSLNGRKPRISRSKVIARLASQRAAGASTGRPRPSIKAPLTPRASGTKTRSSLGAKVSRASYGGVGGLKARASGGAAIQMSAKRRARQSEYYARRKISRGASLLGSAGGDSGMDVDA
ncbi:unnamed protein product [Cyclocybe aegerita]|uniref:SAP domain-containing protein n=1 Tax=Cyclocybe aegerita TaxID=1973307 RepID=A0A8S0WUU0_CYCAE|nr:unnamed protein product [Cyclocybe aegerita]